MFKRLLSISPDRSLLCLRGVSGATPKTKPAKARTADPGPRRRKVYHTAIFCAGIVASAHAATAEAASQWLAAHPANAPANAAVHTTNVHTVKMQIGADIPPPFGYVEFCQRFPRDCKSSPSETAAVHLNGQKQAQLDAVNLSVNKAIQPFRDIDLYGTEEHWTYPQSAGDCEDYALLKMQQLQQLGWPKSALLLSVVYDELGEAHTILLVVTEEGEFVLDNKNNVVKEWNATRYKWLMRQSTENPMRWVRIIG